MSENLGIEVQHFLYGQGRRRDVRGEPFDSLTGAYLEFRHLCGAAGWRPNDYRGVYHWQGGAIWTTRSPSMILPLPTTSTFCKFNMDLGNVILFGLNCGDLVLQPRSAQCNV